MCKEIILKTMDQAFIDEMKAALEAELKTLNEELDSVSSPDTGDHVPGDRAATYPDYGDDAIDADDNSTAESVDYATNVSVTATLEARQKEVQAALARIEAGTYGTAEDGSEISEARLRANPAATSEVQ